MFLYPWGDMHSLNLGWFLLQFKDWVEKIQEYLDNGGGTSENLANVIAPVFNAANSYLTGDYVLYNDELYKALEPVPAGTWNPDAWERCLIVDEMGSGGGAGVDNVARLMIAGNYSPNFGYQKYAICRYNDKLWMCNTNLPSGGEAWNAAHWDEITVGAGLTGLRRSVETLSEDIVNLNSAISNIKNITSASKALLIGDSYNYGSGGIQPYGWGYYLQQLTGATCDIVHQNGGGFTTPGASVATYPNKTYVELVADLDASKNYDFIIVQNGQNDANHGSVSAVNTAVPSFMTAIKAKYPNALVYIIPVFNDAYIDRAKNEILLAVAKKALENGAKTCFNSWFWLINSGVNSSYENHLTDDGYQLLAKYILQFINGWSGDCNFQLNSEARLMGIAELSSAFHNRGSAIETVINSLMIFHGFYTVPNDIAANTKILQLRDSYTYRDTTNIYISSASGAKYFTLDVHPDGGIYARSAITATDTSDPYEVWIIVSVTPNTYIPT